VSTLENAAGALRKERDSFRGEIRGEFGSFRKDVLGMLQQVLDRLDEQGKVIRGFNQGN
jgi:hypothetical protein